jgi:hypothetical protein
MSPHQQSFGNEPASTLGPDRKEFAIVSTPGRTTLFLILTFLVIGLLVYSLGGPAHSAAQNGEKSLDIERYPNEPLEITEVTVGQTSLKKEIKPKLRDNVSKWGRDSVSFKEKDGWFKTIKVKMRNTSGRPIYGLRAGLHFQSSTVRALFELPLTWARDLKRNPLQPGEEIDLRVDDQLLKRALDRMIPYGADPNSSLVSFSLDDAYFGDDLKWSRGHLLRRDPNNHFKWDVVDNPTPIGASRSEKTAGFKVISFNVIAAPQALQTCQADSGGEYDYQCSDDYDYCVRVVEVGNGAPGSLTSFAEPGECRREGVSCLT